MLFRLAVADLWHERMLTFCVVVALTAVMAPLLILFSLKYGLVETLRTRLVNDPRNREIRPELGHNYTISDIESFRRLPSVAFAMPNTRSISSSVKIGALAGETSVDADLLPSGLGDPLLEDNQTPAPGVGTCVLSHKAWTELAPSGGVVAVVHVTASRQGSGQKLELAQAQLEVVGVLPQRASELSAVFTSLEFLEKVESWREGSAVPSLGWAGGEKRLQCVTDQVIIEMPEEMGQIELSELPLKAPWISVIDELPLAEFAHHGSLGEDVSYLYVAATSSRRVDPAADHLAILGLRRSLPADAGLIYAQCRPLSLSLVGANGVDHGAVKFDVVPAVVNAPKQRREVVREVKPEPVKPEAVEQPVLVKPLKPIELVEEEFFGKPEKPVASTPPFEPNLTLPSPPKEPKPRRALPVDEFEDDKVPADVEPEPTKKRGGVPEKRRLKKNRFTPGSMNHFNSRDLHYISTRPDTDRSIDPALSPSPIPPGLFTVSANKPAAAALEVEAATDEVSPPTIVALDEMVPDFEVLMPRGSGWVDGQQLRATIETPSGPVVFPVSVRLHDGAGPMMQQSLAGVLRSALDRSVDYNEESKQFMPSRRGYPSLRLVARTIDDVAVIQDYFKNRGIGVTTASARIRDVKELDRYTNYVFFLIAAVALTGAVGSLLASLIAAVERKRRSYGVLRLLGVKRTTIFRVPVYQSSIVVTFACLLSVLAWYWVARMILKMTAASDYVDGEPIQSLPTYYLWIFWLGAVGVGVVASAFAGVRVMRVEPGEAIRDE